MKRREKRKVERTGTRLAVLLLALFFVAGLAGIWGMGSRVHAAMPAGAFDPDVYQGTTYTIHGNHGSYQTVEVEKLYTNVFYFKDTIVVEDTDITANGTGTAGEEFRFNLVTYDATETASGGYATLKTLEDKGIVRITKGVVLDDTLSDRMKGQTTIAKIEFIHPKYIVKLCSSRSDSPHPSWSGQTRGYRGIISCIDLAAVYATSCELTYSYDGNESDYLWQSGVKSQLPEKLYAPMPSGSYQFTIPLPAGSRGYTDIEDGLGQTSNYDRLDSIADISYEDADSPAFLTERVGTVSPRSDYHDNNLQASRYSNGTLQILGSKRKVEFYTYDGAAVRFHPNGGTIQGVAGGSDFYAVPVRYPRTYTAAEVAALVSVPSRSGYTFAGWGFTDPYSYPNINFGEYTEIQPGYHQAPSYEFLRATPPIFLDLYALWTPKDSPQVKTDLGKEGTLTVKDQVYTGKLLKPAVTVKAGNKKLVRGTDYTVSYKNNQAVGTATVTVKGKGSYTGTLKKTFKINPKPVSLTKLTPGKKKLAVKWKKGNDITGYQIQYSLSEKFSKKKTETLTVTPENIAEKVIKKLTSGKTYHLRIRTYKTVAKAKYYSAWSKAKKVRIK